MHGAGGERVDGLWLARGVVPPYYPNVVTFDAEQPDRQQEKIRSLLEKGPPRPWSVKDSFCTLDLEPLGFEQRFEARWLFRPADIPTDRKRLGLHWTWITSGPRLGRWERAARARNGSSAKATNGQTAEAFERTFPPALLADQRVSVLAAWGDQGPLAGAIVFRSWEGKDGVEAVGISNVFLPDDEREAVRSELIDTVVGRHPGRPVVLWEENGAEVDAFGALDFEPAGELRVWTSPAPGAESDRAS